IEGIKVADFCQGFGRKDGKDERKSGTMESTPTKEDKSDLRLERNQPIDMSVKENVLESESDSKDLVLEKQQIEERVTSKPRGWLSWLSLGMLGAGGTTDSSQFAGVISDDIIKDIYEATMYHPVMSSDIGIVSKGHGYLLSISIDAQQQKILVEQQILATVVDQETK
ncbi:hypothetical protein KI387_002574, partial [Taxus chinensis]